MENILIILFLSCCGSICAHLFVICEIMFPANDVLVKSLTHLSKAVFIAQYKHIPYFLIATRNPSLSLFFALPGLCLTVAVIWLETQALWAVKDSHRSTNPTANVPGTSQ